MIRTQPRMTFHSFEQGNASANVSLSCFQGESGVKEFHLIASPTEYGCVADQLKWVLDAYRRTLRSFGLDDGTSVFRRFFCSDLSNQASVLSAHQDEPCAVSYVCQPPMPPAKVALWAYHVSGPLDKSMQGSSLALVRDDLTHLWTTGVTCTDADTSYGQTEGILDGYERSLWPTGVRLADHVIRTWFFVRDVDANYRGLVKARREVFEDHGLRPDTHFIASTGIEGASADVHATVTMDAYSIAGVRAEQTRYLSAPEHLSPTHIYGVTFERGVSVAYRDRRHVLISGTASIDSAGQIVHPGDVRRQLCRTLENVEALLRNADAGFEDVCMYIVYVRDSSDLDVARRAMKQRFGEVPVQVVTASVCRPGWLIEVECQAIVPASNPSLPAF